MIQPATLTGQKAARDIKIITYFIPVIFSDDDDDDDAGK
jgi:hypothetical protein